MAAYIPKMLPLMGDKQVADALSIHRKTVWVWVNQGKLPKPTKIGGRSLWSMPDIDRAVEKLFSESSVG